MSRSARTAAALGLGVIALLGSCETEPLWQRDVRVSELEVISKPWESAAAHSFTTQITGTAFPIDGSRFVTAAHVIGQYLGSRYSNLVLVDALGMEHPIGKILGYSDAQDVAIFDLADPMPLPALHLRTADLTVGDPVVFMGHQHETEAPQFLENPLVERAPPTTPSIPRDLPEVKDHRNIQKGRGRYVGRDIAHNKTQWIRFTGDSWEGLSGGALTNSAGEVIGIVSHKNGSGISSAVPIDLVPKVDLDAAWIDHSEQASRLALRPPEPLLHTRLKILPATLTSLSDAVGKVREAVFKVSFEPLLNRDPREFIVAGPDAQIACDFLNGRQDSCHPSQAPVAAAVILPPLTDDERRQAQAGTLTMLHVGTALAIRKRAANTRDGTIETNETLHREMAFSGLHDGLFAKYLRERSRSAGDAAADGAQSPSAEITDAQSRRWVQRAWWMRGEDYVLVSVARSLGDDNLVLMNAVPTAEATGALLQLQVIAGLAYAHTTGH